MKTRILSLSVLTLASLSLSIANAGTLFQCQGSHHSTTARASGDYDVGASSLRLRLEVVGDAESHRPVMHSRNVQGPAFQGADGAIRFDNIGRERNVSGEIDLGGGASHVRAPGVPVFSLRCFKSMPLRKPVCRGMTIPCTRDGKPACCSIGSH